MGFTPEYQEAQPDRAAIDAMPGPVLVEVGSPTCGHCRRARPLIEAAMQSHPAVRHVKVADGKGRPFGRSFGVKLWPTLVFMKAGAVVETLVRPVDEAQIAASLGRIDP